MAFADATMSDGTSRTLWGLVKGGSGLFEVIAPANANVYNLKELILEENKNKLKDLDAHQLILLKVSTFLCFSRRERSKAVATPPNFHRLTLMSNLKTMSTFAALISNRMPKTFKN